jgi:death-on-curing family protein
MTDITRLEEAEVLRIRRRLATIELSRRSTFGRPDPVEPGKLSSAVARQWTSNGQHFKYKTLPEVAATLFYGIAMSHAFENGNKRTAMMVLFVFLDRNKMYLSDTTEDDLYSFTERVADHRLEIPKNLERNTDSEVLGVARWLRPRMRSVKAGDKLMTFPDMKRHLTSIGCTFDKPDRNYVKIHLGEHSYRLGYPREEFEVSAATIKEIRRTLHLDSAHGVTAREFYDLESNVDRFVEQHTNLMRRLADL